ncbi:MATE family efflux transporter [Mesobacillus selenatarsenatis]|uniref:Multi antimicrobial extrusion protein (Na(+)/drug antiporter), MATE family of MDR efflux pumps n=1 Tax=Mesobacillus selenatarsenatis (strain DSM 18680 / JCM 14380 / FERM P-15431 / SF-1) TaxID=1321606 RepID=A0A0A8X769_MESS1|nr:MATE family efflux transporter [Mesobacillus selenatarsenatis]GAM15773.1 multi antimicrobial extrusion protein (Na(+)/drug antiporter), MATE family of MDR efflux pumps [Mesobacillus selenatarsenatis SF-1]
MKNKTAKLSLFAITWPLFIEILLYMLMGNADTLMLSQYSDNSVAAVGVSNQILSMVIVMFGFIATGTAILVAQNLGAKMDDDAREVSAVSIGANLVFGLILSAAVFIFSEQLLRLMDLPPELFEEANSYLKIVGGFSFIQSLIMTVSSIIRSYGFTRDIMYVTIGMNVLNVIGNYLFIFGPFGFPVLGVEGVAISTTVSRILGLLAAIYVMTKRVPGSLPVSMLFSFPKKHLKNLLNIGIPSAGEHLSYNGSQMVITYFIATLGTQALTAKVYTQNVMMFIFLFSIAISQGTQILIGHMVGAKEIENAYKRALKSLKLAIIISIATAALVSFFSKDLLGIFTDNMSIIELGTTLILLTIILEPGRSFNLVLISSLRAAGDVKFPVYMGILSMWGVSVTLSYFLGIHLGMGLVGIWIAFIADEWLRGLLMLWRWKSRVWVKKSFVPAK